ncbi:MULTISPECIES: hypothetical protein [Chryseobacterium]|uniref:Uncharacterized protein n=1 Tax=Chryseobacterium pennae TaxID=2258962 RepID=A0A3D9CC99_9FLAO|nr:hypothetical protein [Chryseobacterium pennae]REC63354.1 hypothetical protein DRF65_06795 [Chryseobacterium pennae]
MRGKIILRLALLSVLTLSIYSCRTEDEVLPQEEQAQFRAPIEMFLKFEEKAQADPEFRSQNRQQASGQTNQKNASYNTSPVNIPISQVSYKLPFRETIESFFQNNPALGLEFYKDFGNPFYNVSTYTYGDSSKAIAFPILQGDRVTAFIHGIITPNRDYVQFTIVQNNDPVTLRVLAILQDAVDNLYPKNPTPMGKFAKEQNIRINDIEEITIIKFNVFSGGGGGFGYMFPGREWWKDTPWKEANGAHLGSGGGKAMSGDGSKHKFPDYLDPEDDPCVKLKKQNIDPNFKAKTDFLKKKTGETSESGFRVGNPVSGSGQTGAQYQELSNKPGTTDLDFKIFNTTYGIMHSHYDGLIPIFSPGDINLFIQLLKNAKANNISSGEVFLSVVTSNGVYQLRGDGINADNLNMYTDAQFGTLNKEYLKLIGDSNISTTDIQKGFLNFMNKNMKIDGAKLYEVNNDGSSTQLQLNGNNLKTLNCP